MMGASIPATTVELTRPQIAELIAAAVYYVTILEDRVERDGDTAAKRKAGTLGRAVRALAVAEALS